MIKEGFMPHNDDRYPVSRDWQEIDCSASNCINNNCMKCLIPSLAVIGEDGKCLGYKSKEYKKTDRKTNRQIFKIGESNE